MPHLPDVLIRRLVGIPVIAISAHYLRAGLNSQGDRRNGRPGKLGESLRLYGVAV
jgi:hypothetical protein